MKDVLARAAAKGLLEGIELGKSSKREKKKKKGKVISPKAPNVDISIQAKIAEFLHRESVPSVSHPDRMTAKAFPQKPTSQASPSSQARKHKPATVPVVIKNLPPRQQPFITRSRPSGRVMPLKRVEIVLPPVMLPFSSYSGIKPHFSGQRFFYHWGGSKIGSKNPLPGYLSTAPTAKKGEKPKENVHSSQPQRPQPWL